LAACAFGRVHRCLPFGERGSIGGRTSGPRERSRGPSGSAEHFARLNGLKRGAHVVAAVLKEFHVALDRLAVQAFALRDLLCPFGERSGQVAPRQVKAQAARKKWGCIVAAVE